MNIYIKVTESCNLQCKHCYNPYLNCEIDYDSVKFFLSKINNIVKHNYFILHGGEPLMANQDKIIDLINSFPNNKWRISTNLCYEMTSKRLQILSKMSEIRVSFDVGIRFNNIKNLLQWKKNVTYLSKKLKYPLFFNICLTKQLLQHKPLHILKMLDSFKVKIFSLERITLSGNAINNKDIIPTYEEIDNWLCELYKDLKYFPDIKCLSIESIKMGIYHHFEHCYGKQCCCQTLTINSNGTIGNCPNDARINIIGNLNDDPNFILMKIWNKKHIIKQKCLKCDHYDKCRGWCEQMDWQGDICPYPFKLSELIKNEYSSII